MGVYSGPDVSESGLVLALDVGNYKNSRSSVSTNLVSNGSFANGVGSPNESGSNPTNTIVQLENPGETSFVLRQNGNNTEYQLNISGLTASTTYVMSGWYAKSSDYNGGDTMFHARTFSSSGAHIATGVDTGTLLRSITLGSTTWEYRYKTISTPSDSTGYMEWYVGYGTNNTTGYRYYTNLKIEKGTFPSLLNMVGDSNHGTPTNGLSYSSTNGGSLVFDGTDDYISVSNTSQLRPSTELSIGMWIKANSITAGWVRLFGQDPYTGGPLIFLETGGSLIRALHYPNGVEVRCNTNYSISTTQYTYVVFTFKTGDAIRSYFNGVANTTVALSAGTFSYNTSNPYLIGHSGASWFNGNISNISFYNKALTASEIQQNFNATRSRFGI